MGFSYRSVLGELMYAYVTTRPDIGYAVVTLSKFSTAPAEVHFVRLKGVAKYLRRTVNWGINYWRPRPSPDLPPDPDDPMVHPTDLPPFPTILSLLIPICYVDAAHANDLRQRRSTTGFAICLAGGVILYKSRTQSQTATSSTEAEFIAAVTAAKACKYIRAVLSDLGYPVHDPTPIYEDNASTINIINHSIPTDRSRHIDIQYFAIQDWKQAGDIILLHIPGILNPSDDLTKALGWILHSRHARRLMGHFRPVLTVPSVHSVLRDDPVTLVPGSGEGIIAPIRTDGQT